MADKVNELSFYATGWNDCVGASKNSTGNRAISIGNPIISKFNKEMINVEDVCKRIKKYNSRKQEILSLKYGG